MSLKYALVTPSFRLDLDRCSLLAESVKRHVAPHVIHYLVIDRRDLPLFSHLAGERTKILIAEDIIPSWIQRIPGVRRFWWSWRSLPIRNWILQQIVKISVANAIEEDVLLFVDSDMFFVTGYDPRTYERNGQVPLFMETKQRGLIPNNDLWHACAAKLLGRPQESEYDTNFVGNVICWRRANVLKMMQHIADAQSRNWIVSVASLKSFSEYVVYGMYVTRVLGDASGHYQDDVDRTLCYWKTIPLNQAELSDRRSSLTDKHHSVMISGKSKTNVEWIRSTFF